MRAPSRRRVVPLCLALAVAVTVACTADPEPPPSSPAAKPETRTLTWGVYGSQHEIDAYQEIADTYNQSVEGVRVELETWPTSERLADDLLDGGDVPDVFMLSRDDLARATEQEVTLPVLELMDERGVDFGDGYSRVTLEAFSAQGDLQCMPYSVSPTLIYFNPDLVDFERMERRQLDTPQPDEPTGRYLRWSFDQFRAAAQFASRPRLGSKGVHVDPTLRGLAPFVYSAGADLYDDHGEPHSLALSSDGGREALTGILEVLREPSVTLTERQLETRDAVEWFKRGRLGMIVGDRSMVPELRRVPGLRFDVLPMPTIDTQVTTARLGGQCLAADGPTVPRAADFLVYITSAEAVARVASLGYLVPANLHVAQSEDFLQPNQQPRHSQVFNDTVTRIRVEPLLLDPRALERAVNGGVRQLFQMPLLDLEAVTERIDERSRAVLDPEGERYGDDEDADDTDDAETGDPDRE